MKWTFCILWVILPLFFVFSLFACSYPDFWQALLISHPLFPTVPGWHPRILLTWPSRKLPPVQWSWHWRWSSGVIPALGDFIPSPDATVLSNEKLSPPLAALLTQRRASWSLLGLSCRHLGSRLSFQATNWGVWTKSRSFPLIELNSQFEPLAHISWNRMWQGVMLPMPLLGLIYTPEPQAKWRLAIKGPPMLAVTCLWSFLWREPHLQLSLDSVKKR